MQSWGVESHFDQRDTGTEPSKSGVLGLLCAALGVDRSDWERLEPMTRWRMGVRIESPGHLRSDFQTAQLKPWNPKSDTATSRRYYLADADFYVGFETVDRDALVCAHQALKNPHWALCLGRKAFPPGQSIYLEDGLRDEGLQEALIAIHLGSDSAIKLAIETTEGEHSERWDQPVAAFVERRYGPRRVRYLEVDVPNLRL